jgi:hypothetical protein
VPSRKGGQETRSTVTFNVPCSEGKHEGER